MFTEPLPSLPEAAVLDTVRGKELLALCASFRQHSVDAVGKLAAILEPLEANLAHFADEVQDIAEEVVSVQEPANAVPSQGSRQRLDTIIDRAHDVAADLAPWRTQAGHAHQVTLTHTHICQRHAQPHTTPRPRPESTFTSVDFALI